MATNPMPLQLSTIRAPCGPNCPDRTLDCRKRCRKYKVYEIQKLAEYNKRKSIYMGAYKLKAPEAAARKLNRRK